MRQKVIVVKITKKVFCYKEIQALDNKGGLEITPDCPFGLVDFDDKKCSYCKWYSEKILKADFIEEIKPEIKK